MGSLFAGIGGFDLGFERAGFKTVWQVEIDPYAQKVLAKNFPEAERFGDIRECGSHNLKPVDVICGGFPCQDISNAGLRAGIEGERSGLWKEYARIIGELRPRYIVVENVAALLGRGMGVVLGDLAEIGYDAEWEVVSAADVGAPHLRERIWIVAYPRSEGRRKIAGSAHGDEGQNEGWAEIQVYKSSGDGEGCGARNVSYAYGEGLSLTGNTGGIGEAPSGIEPRAATDGDGWWAVEPNVGRGFDGVSVWLDRCVGRGLSNEESRRRVEVLRSVWSGVLSESLWRAAGGLDRIQQAQVLFSFVREYEEGSHEARLLVEGQKAPEGFLRGLRIQAQAGSASRRSGQGEQLAGEHPDAMQLLPRLLAHDSEKAWTFDSWEDAVPRVANGIPARVDRLRGLGNAVVPQIPEMIAKRIKMALEAA
jgi:site-specific DNA-cytosine methylase